MTLVKICGITNLDDALMAVRFKADMIGLNFYPQSPRFVDTARAKYIAGNMPNDTRTVGVFVNYAAEKVVEIASEVGLDMIQLHGDETQAYIDRAKSITNLPILKAIRVQNGGTIAEFVVDGVLLDAFSRGEYGGTGITFDWEVAAEYKERYPVLFLAGGLSPENVAEAVRRVRPYAVDVASGVELAKGKKDPEKMESFIRNAKQV